MIRSIGTICSSSKQKGISWNKTVYNVEYVCVEWVSFPLECVRGVRRLCVVCRCDVGGAILVGASYRLRRHKARLVNHQCVARRLILTDNKLMFFVCSSFLQCI